MSTLHRLIQELWPIQPSSPVLISTFIVVFLFLLNHLTAPRYTALEPPPLPHVLPFFGHALSFVRDQRAFFEWANKKSNGNPFSVLLAGDKLHIFPSPAAAAQIFRKSSTLHETRTDQLNFRLNILGFLPRDAARIAELRDTERSIHAKHLLAAGPLEELLGRYLEQLDGLFERTRREILAAEAAVKGGRPGRVRKVGFEFVGETVIHATIQALFGHDSFADYPNIFGDFRQFLSEHFFERLIGMPNCFARGAVRARQRIKKRVGEVVAKIMEGRLDVSRYNAERIEKLGGMGLSREGLVSNEFDIILGSNLNSIPIAYLCLLHLLQDPKLLAAVRSELASADLSSPSSRAAAFLSTTAPPALPRLRALLHEVLRYHTTSWSAREVVAPTTITLSDTDGDTSGTGTAFSNNNNNIESNLRTTTTSTETTDADSSSSPPASSSSRTYTLSPPAILALPSSLLHHDPAIHSEPHVFRAGRFLGREHAGGHGTRVAAGTLRAFGGGLGLCPGRRFAEGQVLGFVGGLVEGFDVDVEVEAVVAEGGGGGEGQPWGMLEEGVWGWVGWLFGRGRRKEVREGGMGRGEIPRNADFFYVTRQKGVGILVNVRGKKDGLTEGKE